VTSRLLIFYEQHRYLNCSEETHSCPNMDAANVMLALLILACTAKCQEMPDTTTVSNTMTTTPVPCWMEAFPPPNNTLARNDLTCEICTTIFQGLDDFLLNNEDQIAHALENLCEGFPWLFEICWRLVEACMDDIIEMIIRDGLNPKDMCETLYLCP